MKWIEPNYSSTIQIRLCVFEISRNMTRISLSALEFCEFPQFCSTSTKIWNKSQKKRDKNHGSQHLFTNDSICFAQQRSLNVTFGSNFTKNIIKLCSISGFWITIFFLSIKYLPIIIQITNPFNFFVLKTSENSISWTAFRWNPQKIT